MAAWQSIGLGLTLALAAWILLRLTARAWQARLPALLLDVAPCLWGFALLFVSTTKPVFAGVLSLGLFGGLAFVDRVKRATLMEPVVFSDLWETIELFRHPRLYLPFAGTHRVLLGALAAGSVLAALFVFEPAQWQWSLWPMAGALGLTLAVIWLVGGPLLAQTARALWRLGPTGDPVRDAKSLGTLAMMLVYGIIARAERSRRRTAASPRPSPSAIIRRCPSLPPVLVVQCESFFDPRRIHPAVSPDLLQTFDACCRAGVASGRLAVPSWGANTVRTEFAVLTGLTEETLGFDRFNPYHAFAHVPVSSLAWRMRSEGYRTICVHPFDRTFLKRDRALANLGFEVFLGEENFGNASRAGHYITDIEVARFAVDLLREEQSAVFLFAITMENHGPWHPATAHAAALDLAPGLPEVRGGRTLKHFLRGIQGANSMMRILCDHLAEHWKSGCLAVYGDHLPSFREAFAQLGFQDTRTDYVVWNAMGGSGLRRNLAAHELPEVIWQALSARSPAISAISS